VKTTNKLFLGCDQRCAKDPAIVRKAATILVLTSLVLLLSACGLIGSKSQNSGSNSLAITTTSLNSGTVGTQYTTTLAASGGTTPYTWNASGLPSGLSLSSSGALSGTPSASGTFSISVKVTDAANTSASATLTLAIQTSGVLTITSVSMPAGTVSSGYSELLTASGGKSPYSWTLKSGALPAGLSLNATGLISGTVTATPASYSFSVQVTDSVQAIATQSLTITIAQTLTLPPLVPGSDLTVTTGNDTWGDNTILVTSTGYFAVQLSDGSKYGNGPSHTGLDSFWDLKNDPTKQYDLAGSDAGLLSKDFAYAPTTLNSTGMFETKPGGGTIQVLEENTVRVVLEYDWPVRPYGNNSYPVDPSLNGKEIWTIYRPGKIYERFSFTNNTTQPINMGGSACPTGQQCYFQYNFHTSWTKFDGEGPYYDSSYWQSVPCWSGANTYIPCAGSPWGFVNENADNSPTPSSWMLHTTVGGFSMSIPPGPAITPGIVIPLGTTTNIPVHASFLEVPYEDTGADAYRGELFAGMRSKLQVGFNVPPGTDSLVRHLVLHAGDNGIVDRTTAMVYAAEYRNAPSLTMTVGSINTAGGAQASGFNPDRGCYELTASGTSVDFTVSGALYDPAFNISNWATAAPATIRINGATANLNTDYVAVADSGRLLIQIIRAVAGGAHIQVP